MIASEQIIVILTPRMSTVDIIPIRFLGGTGGHFVDAWITEAKFRNLNLPYDKQRFSSLGNAHDFPKEFEEVIHRFTVSSPVEEHMDAILKVKPSYFCSHIAPYTLLTHIRDGKLLEEHFKKVIHISCEPDDIETIAKVFVSKNNKLSDIELQERISFTRLKIHDFYPSNNPNVLNLFWKELIRGDPFMLKEKVEQYTMISNLDIEFLLTWRRLTFPDKLSF